MTENIASEPDRSMQETFLLSASSIAVGPKEARIGLSQGSAI